MMHDREFHLCRTSLTRARRAHAALPWRSRAWRRTAAALAGAFALGWSSAAPAALIELKESAEVATAIVHLGQVAHIHDDDEKLVERLAAVTLFPAPTVGRTKAVEFETIRTRLVSLGFTLSDIEFSGSSLVTVSGTRSDDGSFEEGSSA